jgi:hypothetical protein
MFAHCRDDTLCLRSSIAMVSVLATSRGLCRHCSHHWVLASPHSSSAPRGYFVGTRTCGMWVWSSRRGLWMIVSTASARLSRPLHRGRRSKDCHGFYRGFAKNLVRIQFHLGDCGSTDQGSSLYTCQDHLLCTATSWVVYIEDSLSTWSAEEDCV